MMMMVTMTRKRKGTMMMMVVLKLDYMCLKLSDHLLFLQSYFEGGGCRAIGAEAHVHHQGSVEAIGDEVVATQLYGFDAAENARNGLRMG